MLDSPLLLGHRGARRFPGIGENTFAAFDLALRAGCDGFEFDVRLSSDGIAVIAHDPIFGEQDVGKTPAARLSLQRLDDVLLRYAQQTFLDIELKVPGLGSAAVRTIQKHLPRHCIVSSFSPIILDEVHNLDDSVALGFICEDRSKLPEWRGLPCEYVIAQHRLVSRKLIESIHASGRKIIVWTVNTPLAMRKLANAGVDGIISDDPELLCRTLRPWR
jgi:glycerophosphoryl diester phosphodiesterase